MSDPTSRNAALDRLNAALAAAEKHLFELNPGVPGYVLLDDPALPSHPNNPPDRLMWGKFEGAWCLHIGPSAVGRPPPMRLSQASAHIRKLAAHALPALLKQLRINAGDEISDIISATVAVDAFIRSLSENK